MLDGLNHCPALISVSGADFLKMLFYFVVGQKIKKYILGKIAGMQICSLLGNQKFIVNFFGSRYPAYPKPRNHRF